MTEPVTDVETLKQFIRERARQTWDQRASPYYLSFVGTDLGRQGVDYREFIAPLKLSQWASSTELPDTKVVAHPRHKAKVGFVPVDADFAFSDDTEITQATPSSRPLARRRGRALLSFVESLTNLSDDALDGFQVPAKTLVQLLKS